MKKDKQAVIDEVWTPERVRSFLQLQPPEGWDADYYVLFQSYRSMRLEDFRLLLQYFVAAGRALDTLGPDGSTLMSLLSRHRRSGEYAQALHDAAAVTRPAESRRAGGR